MRRTPAKVLALIWLLCLSLLVPGCWEVDCSWNGGASDAAAPADGASRSDDAGDTEAGRDRAEATPESTGADVGPPPEAERESAGLVRIEPLAPRTDLRGALASRNAMVYALVDAAVDRARLRVDGRALDVDVLHWASPGRAGPKDYLVRAEAPGLSNGTHEVELEVVTSGGAEALVGWSFDVDAAEPPGEAAEGATVTLYFPDRALTLAGFDGEFGITRPVQRTVDAEGDLVEAAVEELIRGPLPEDGEVAAGIPPTARLLGMEVEGGVARLDFSEEFARDHWGGTQGLTQTVQSIVYTLTEFPEIDAVQVLVNGEPWDDGHMVWEDPIGRLSTEGLEVTRLPADGG